MATEFLCPACQGRHSEIWRLPRWGMLHWILNPGLCVNELVFGQRLPAMVFFCKDCKKPRVARQYLHCPECGEFHHGLLWSRRNAFGHWLGYVCPRCGERIPCLWNLFSLVLLAATWPLWWIPYQIFREDWLELERRRIAAAAAGGIPHLEEEAARLDWVRLGLWCWAAPAWVFFSLLLPYVLLEGQSWKAAGLLSFSFCARLCGGACWGLMTKKALSGMAGLGKLA